MCCGARWKSFCWFSKVAKSSLRLHEDIFYEDSTQLVLWVHFQSSFFFCQLNFHRRLHFNYRRHYNSSLLSPDNFFLNSYLSAHLQHFHPRQFFGKIFCRSRFAMNLNWIPRRKRKVSTFVSANVNNISVWFTTIHITRIVEEAAIIGFMCAQWSF